MPAPMSRVFCPCFRAAETSNNKQWYNSGPKPGSNKWNSGERKACLWLLHGSHAKWNALKCYSLDNIHHLKLGNAASHPFITLVNSARRKGELDFITASSTSMQFATGITLPRLWLAALPLPDSHYAEYPCLAWLSGRQLLYSSVMPGLSRGRGLPVQSKACYQMRELSAFPIAEISGEGQGPISGPRDISYLLVCWPREEGWI